MNLSVALVCSLIALLALISMSGRQLLSKVCASRTAQSLCSHLNSAHRRTLMLCRAEAIAKWFVVVSMASCSLAHAESKELQKDDRPYVFQLASLSAETQTAETTTPPWVVEIKKESEWIPHHIEDTSSNRFCMSIRFFNQRIKDNIDEYAFVDNGEGVYQPGRSGLEGELSCDNTTANSLLPPFEVVVQISPALKDTLMYQNDAYATRVNVTVDLSDSKTRVSDYQFALHAQHKDGSWRLIGGLNIDGFNQSRWIQGPQGQYSLLLVGENSESTPATANVADSESEYIPSLLDLSGLQSPFEITAHEAQVVPTIKFKAEQSVSELMLEVLPGLSQPAQGWYCVRAVYKENDSYLAFVDTDEGWQTATPVIMGVYDNSSCTSTGNLVFPIYLKLGPESSGQSVARLFIGRPSRDADLDLHNNIRISLRAGGGTSGEVLARFDSSRENPGSGWTSIDDHLALVLSSSGDTAAPTSVNETDMSSQSAVALTYGGNGEPPEDILFANGQPWKNWDDMRELRESLEIAWDATLGHPGNIRLCSDTECTAESLIATLEQPSNPFVLVADLFAGFDRAYVMIDWIPPLGGGVSSTSLSAQSTASEMTFAPVVKYGEYMRPLTACIGRMVSATQSGGSFSLKLGMQTLQAADWPSNVSDQDSVKLVFDTARGGGECPVPGLESQEYFVSDLLDLAAAGPITVELSVSAPLFVGYFQLNGADYRSTLVRWREVIELLSRTYKFGRENALWLDGIAFSAGEKGGVFSSIEPNSNFVSALSDEDSLLNIAQSLESNTRVSSDVFSEQVRYIKEIVGPTPISLVYFDDYLSECGIYQNELARSGMNVDRAIIVAAIDGYTGNEGVMRSLGDGLAHVCEESVASNVIVYAFNWKEQLGNLAWEKTFNTIYDDMLQQWK